MPAECLLDTNILVYAAAGREKEEGKRIVARALIEKWDFCVSAQVLAEFYVVATRKLDAPLSPDRALEWIEHLESRPVVPIDAALVKIGVEISERYRISYWDGAILAAAEVSSAPLLYSEDLNHGQRYGSVEVRNPFLGAHHG